MKFSVAFEGGDELASNLAQLSMRLSKKILREALIEGGEPMRQDMGRFAPREPGAPDLADNMGISNARTGDMAAIAIGPVKGFFYGWFQEYGTKHFGGQAFARPAFDGNVHASLGIIGQALWRELAGRGFSRSATVSTPLQDEV